MGSAISPEQIERLEWILSRVGFPYIVLFLDRDQVGRDGARQARERLRRHNLAVTVFDWDQNPAGRGTGNYPEKGKSMDLSTQN